MSTVYNTIPLSWCAVHSHGMILRSVPVNPNGWIFVIGVSAYTVLHIVQRPGVNSAVYGTVQHKEHLSFDNIRKVSRLISYSFCRDIAMIVQKATWNSSPHSSLRSGPHSQTSDRVEWSLEVFCRHGLSLDMVICTEWFQSWLILELLPRRFFRRWAPV